MHDLHSNYGAQCGSIIACTALMKIVQVRGKVLLHNASK